MAKIVCIAAGTVRSGINETGDIVSIHDDDVELTGGGYDSFTIHTIPGVTAIQVRERLASIQPEQAVAFEISPGEWSFTKSTEDDEEKRVWKDAAGKWYFLEDAPKYSVTMTDLTGEAKTSLEDDKISAVTRLSTIESGAKEKISLDEKNMVEATDLNKIVLGP